jgi:hypothetical protein
VTVDRLVETVLELHGDNVKCLLPAEAADLASQLKPHKSRSSLCCEHVAGESRTFPTARAVPAMHSIGRTTSAFTSAQPADFARSTRPWLGGCSDSSANVRFSGTVNIGCYVGNTTQWWVYDTACVTETPRIF